MEPARTHHRLLTKMRGFTLVEMLVVLAIIIIITSVALLGQTGFNRSLTLTDTTYTVALSIREAQSLGLSSRKFDAIQNAGYGAYFTVGNTYVQFADIYPVEGSGAGSLGGICPGHTQTSGPEARPGNCLYEAGQDGLLKTYQLNRGFRISQFCGKTTNGAAPPVCSDSGTPLTSLSIVFLRPNTESTIIGMRSGLPIELTSAEIKIEPPEGGASRYVCVSKVGQVAVSATACP